MTQHRIFGEIKQERKRQDLKFGSQAGQSDSKWAMIAGEEMGEIHRAILNLDKENLREEIVQLAAVCVAWLECFNPHAHSNSVEESSRKNEERQKVF